MTRLWRPCAVVAATIACASPALTQDAPAGNPDAAQYLDCLAAVEADPAAGYEEALAWRAQGGGWTARHCAALGLIAQGYFGEGASSIERAEDQAVVASDVTRAILLGQAGDAWLLAEEPERALRAFGRAAAFAPDDAGLRLGLAQAALALDDFAAAEAVANFALGLDPGAVEALRLRAEARLEQGDLDGARADLNAALEASPEAIDLLVLRGRVIEARRLAGGAD